MYISGPTQDLLNQKFQRHGPGICVVRVSPDASMITVSLKTTALEQLTLLNKTKNFQRRCFNGASFSPVDIDRHWEEDQRSWHAFLEDQDTVC